MGRQSVQIAKTPEEAQLFMDMLLRDIHALEFMIENNLIETGVQRIGAEQEVHLVDSNFKPAPVVMDMLKLVNDRHFTTEHATFNAEINIDPLLFEHTCISKMESQLARLITKGRQALKKLDANLIYTGILPTISPNDLSNKNLTPLARYSLLSAVYDRIRGEPYNIHIKGMDQLITRVNSTMFEGSNTSFQTHLQIDANDFVKYYNWAQLISGPVLSVSTNSPLFLGKRLWRETRIALFEQSIDTRKVTSNVTYKTPRVFFGKKWVKKSPLEIFREDVARHRIILDGLVEEDPIEMLKKGLVPSLQALSIHNGTVYRWNRPCYGITKGKPHLRIENRYLPAGPSLKDQMANMAFWLGLMNGIPKPYENIPKLIDFDKAKANFISAARLGLGTSFNWINNKRISAPKLILNELLPIAEDGLKKANITQQDIEEYLGVIQLRVRTGKTGSQWMLDSFNKIKEEHTRGSALVALTGAIISNQETNLTVDQWSIATIDDAGGWKNRYWKVGQFMSTDLFTVHENDIVKLAADVMRWEHIRHVPVENDKGVLVGILTAGMLLKFFGFRDKTIEKPIAVKELMIKNPIIATPDTTSLDAINLMIKHKVGCLPIVSNGELIGIVTEHDFMKFSKVLLHEYSHRK